MKFSTAIFSSALVATLATAAPLEERAGPTVSLDLFSDNNCANRIRTVTLSNVTCTNAGATFNSARVSSGATQAAYVSAYNVAGCSNRITKAFFVNDVTTCHNDFQQGSGAYLRAFFGSSAS